jgi:hemerythrin-like domain-containing protein
MKATEQLKAEHQGIKLMLGILGRICDRLEAGEAVNREHPAQVVEFFTVFVDKCHHGKEEGLLFPAMAAAKIPGFEGPIEMLLSEHRSGREYMKAVREAAARYSCGDREAASIITANARAYSKLLFPHIDKEDNVLFPMADAFLPSQKHEELVERFDRIERDRIGDGVHEAFHTLMRRLKEFYLK